MCAQLPHPPLIESVQCKGMQTQLKQALTERIELGHSQEKIVQELVAAGYEEAAATEAYRTVAAELETVKAAESTTAPASPDADAEPAAANAPAPTTTAPVEPSTPPYLRNQTEKATNSSSTRWIISAVVLVILLAAIAAAVYFIDINRLLSDLPF